MDFVSISEDFPPKIRESIFVLLYGGLADFEAVSLYKGTSFMKTCLYFDMADDSDEGTQYYLGGWARKAFRITSFILHVVIAALAGFFYMYEIEAIKRSDIVKHDWKYIEFIERIYNNKVEQGEYTLEMLGTDAVYKKGFKSDAVYFDSGKTADQVFLFSIDDDPPSITAKRFFEDISSLIEGASFASPLYLYKKNAQIYGLPGQLCSSDFTRIFDSSQRDAMIGSKPPDSVGLLSRFCKPNIAPSVDYGYCLSAFQKHQYIMLGVGGCTGLLSICIPIFYSLMHLVKKVTQEQKTVNLLAKSFHHIEDLHMFVDSIALVAFIMEVVEGFPSGFANTRCPHSATSLYVVYMMFNTIFVLLCVLTCISTLTWVLDFVVSNTYASETDLAQKITWWNTRQDELVATELFNYTKVPIDDPSEDVEVGAGNG